MSKKIYTLRNVEFWLWKFTAVITNQQRGMEQRYVAYGQYQNVTANQIWVTRQDGVEESIDLTNCAIDVRVGQQVTLVVGASTKMSAGSYLKIYNHNSRKDAWFLYRENILDNMGLQNLSFVRGSDGKYKKPFWNSYDPVPDFAVIKNTIDQFLYN